MHTSHKITDYSELSITNETKFRELHPELDDRIKRREAYQYDQIPLDLDNAVVAIAIGIACCTKLCFDKSCSGIRCPSCRCHIEQGPSTLILKEALREKRERSLKRCDESTTWHLYKSIKADGHTNTTVIEYLEFPMVAFRRQEAAKKAAKAAKEKEQAEQAE